MANVPEVPTYDDWAFELVNLSDGSFTSLDTSQIAIAGWVNQGATAHRLESAQIDMPARSIGADALVWNAVQLLRVVPYGDSAHEMWGYIIKDKESYTERGIRDAISVNVVPVEYLLHSRIVYETDNAPAPKDGEAIVVRAAPNNTGADFAKDIVTACVAGRYPTAAAADTRAWTLGTLVVTANVHDGSVVPNGFSVFEGWLDELIDNLGREYAFNWELRPSVAGGVVTFTFDTTDAGAVDKTTGANKIIINDIGAMVPAAERYFDRAEMANAGHNRGITTAVLNATSITDNGRWEMQTNDIKATDVAIALEKTDIKEGSTFDFEAAATADQVQWMGDLPGGYEAGDLVLRNNIRLGIAENSEIINGIGWQFPNRVLKLEIRWGNKEPGQKKKQRGGKNRPAADVIPGFALPAVTFSNAYGEGVGEKVTRQDMTLLLEIRTPTPEDVAPIADADPGTRWRFINGTNMDITGVPAAGTITFGTTGAAAASFVAPAFAFGLGNIIGVSGDVVHSDSTIALGITAPDANTVVPDPAASNRWSLTSVGGTVTITAAVAHTVNFEVAAAALPFAVPAVQFAGAAAAGAANSVMRSDSTILLGITCDDANTVYPDAADNNEWDILGGTGASTVGAVANTVTINTVWDRGDFDSVGAVVMLRPADSTDPVMIGAALTDASTWYSDGGWDTFLDVRGNIRVGRVVYSSDTSLRIFGLDAGRAKVHVGDGAVNGWFDVNDAADAQMFFIDANPASESWISDDFHVKAAHDLVMENAVPAVVGTWDGATGSIECARDADVTSYLGRAAVGYNGVSADQATFAHVDHNSDTNQALRQNNQGRTNLNAAAGVDIRFRINNVDRMVMDATDTMLYSAQDLEVYDGAPGNLMFGVDGATGDTTWANAATTTLGNYTYTWPLAGAVTGESLIATVAGANITLSWAAPAPAAHNLLSASHGDTVASAMTRGDLVVGTAGGWDDLAIGAINTHLESDGVDAAWVLPDIYGAPATCTVVTANVAGIAHTHAITTSSNPGAAASILATDAAGSISISGNLDVADSIRHIGDVTTLMRFTAAVWQVQVTGTDTLRCSVAGVIVNQGGDPALDFRCEADTNDHALFVDATGAGAVEVWNSADVEIYSDAGVSQVGLWDGATGSIEAARDANITSYLGRAAVGYNGVDADQATFAHVDHNSNTNQALRQSNAGRTNLNAATGVDIRFRINDAVRMIMDATDTMLYSGQDLEVYDAAPGNLVFGVDGATGDTTWANAATTALGAYIYTWPLAGAVTGESLIATVAGANITLSWAAPAPAAHVVNSTGPHAEAGLTIGHVLRVTGAAAFSFAALIATDLPAHNLLSAQHGDTVASAMTQGDLVIGTAGGWDDLPIGAINTHLESDGVDAAWVLPDIYGAPATCTVATANVAGIAHTHAITTSSNPGAFAFILASTAAGGLTLVSLTCSNGIGCSALNVTNNIVVGGLVDGVDVAAHTHGVTGGATGAGSAHTHTLSGQTGSYIVVGGANYNLNPLRVIGTGVLLYFDAGGHITTTAAGNTAMVIGAASHYHELAGNTGDNPPGGHLATAAAANESLHTHGFGTLATGAPL